jgi:hypothetical protein
MRIKLRQITGEILNHLSASLTLEMVIAVFAGTSLKITRQIQAMKTYKQEFRHGLFPIKKYFVFSPIEQNNIFIEY